MKNQLGSVPDGLSRTVLMDAAHLFKPSTTRVAIRNNEYLHGYTHDFIELFAPHLTREVVAKAMHVSPLAE